MIQDFSVFEQHISNVSRQLPGMPQERVVLNRMLFFAVRELDDVYNRRLAEFGLNTSSFLSLAMLMGCEGNRLNPCDLSDALTSSRTNVTRLVDELVSAGWVDRQPSADDRRRVDLTLTDAGRSLVLEVLPEVWKLIERQWSGLDKDEIAEFDRLLRKMVNGMMRCKEDA